MSDHLIWRLRNNHTAKHLCGLAADEIERLKVELREERVAILELQQEACDRAGVPMPSQRSVVDRMREMLGRVSHLNSFRELNDILPEVRALLGTPLPTDGAEVSSTKVRTP